MLNKGNRMYIAFLAICLPLFFIFITSNKWMPKKSSDSVSERYQSTITINGYYIKVDNATYNTDTKEYSFVLYCKNNVELDAAEPTIYSISVDYALDTFCDYQTESDSNNIYGTIVKVKNIEDKFKYIRIFFESKKADVVIPESVDEFGNVIPATVEEGETIYTSVIIDKMDTTIINNNTPQTSAQTVIFDNENAIDYTEEDVSAVSSTTTLKLQEESPDTVTNTPVVVTTAPVVTTTPEQATTTTAATTKVTEKKTSTTTKKVTTTTKKATTTTKPKPVTTTKKVTTTTKKVTTTAKATTTTKKITTTTKATTTLTPIRLRGLALKTVSADNTVYIKVGESTQVTPVYTPAQATNKKVYWSSNREDRAVVDSNGKVTGRSAGAVIIKCVSDDGGLSAACMIVVVDS